MHSAIFEGSVRHHRRAPRGHAFAYRLFMMYLDLAELDEVFRGRWFWSRRRRALARFRREDHFGDPAETLDHCVRRLVEQHTGRRPAGPIRLLTHLSYFGYCFNPVSFFYCYDRSGERLESIIAEVNNTPWGERHLYVLPAEDGERAAGALAFSPAKAMHVSPFMPMDVDYRWCFSPPAQRIDVHMENTRGAEKLFSATLSLKRREISGRSLARVLTLYPLMTIKVIVAIHWQALRLWLKGTPVHNHPDQAGQTVENRS